MARFILALIILLASSTSVFAADDDRPRALPALYTSLATLQLLDGYTTMRTLGQGGRELNPIVSPIVNQPIAFWSLKAASTGVSIYFAEQLWRQHRRTQAILTMVVANGVMAAVAAHNASVLRPR